MLLRATIMKQLIYKPPAAISQYTGNGFSLSVKINKYLYFTHIKVEYMKFISRGGGGGGICF